MWTTHYELGIVWLTKLQNWVCTQHSVIKRKWNIRDKGCIGPVGTHKLCRQVAQIPMTSTAKSSPPSQPAPMAPWKVLCHQLTKEEKNTGLVYKWFCTTFWRHLKMNSYSTRAPLGSGPEGRQWREIFPGRRTLNVILGYLSCLEGETARSMDLHCFMCND